MKKIFILLFVIFTLCSCAKRTYIHDYSQRIQVIKTNFPELYDMYCKGIVIINDVYLYEKGDDIDIKVNYHYR